MGLHQRRVPRADVGYLARKIPPDAALQSSYPFHSRRDPARTLSQRRRFARYSYPRVCELFERDSRPGPDPASMMQVVAITLRQVPRLYLTVLLPLLLGMVCLGQVPKVR